MTLFVDYSWTHPNPAAIKAAGYSGVMRYLSSDPTKNLTRAEADALHAAGLSIGLVWETDKGRAGTGAQNGSNDVAAAETMADALGYPNDAVIFYAVDYDADPAAVLPYFNAVRAGAKRPVGVYGSLRVVNTLRQSGVPYAWQTCAWSGTSVSGSAHLYQRLHATVATPLSGTDEDVVLAAFPCWQPDGSVSVSRSAGPGRKSFSHNTGLATEKPWGAFPLRVGYYSTPSIWPWVHSGFWTRDQRAVKQIQREVGVAADGHFGPVTFSAVVAWQQRHGLVGDGKVGRLTWAAMCKS